MASVSRQTHKLIIEDSKGQEEYTLDSALYSIGRDPTCDIRLSSYFVSRHHATLVRFADDEGNYCYRIMDGNLQGKLSANGLLINGRKLAVHDLQNRDKIIFGPQVQAVYYLLEREHITTVPPDEFDITLINPSSMMPEEGETPDSIGELDSVG
ncbi:MAG: FHA domain-containing protein [Elainella sp. Prado103]|jgi:pSer/pThr/pTyr-binding forkhead associated (FHA) protein|nr:FHA domain-containing protein [Elainella sp. Prado103]